MVAPSSFSLYPPTHPLSRGCVCVCAVEQVLQVKGSKRERPTSSRDSCDCLVLFRTAAEFSFVVAWLLERWTDAHRDAPTFFGPFVTTPVISIINSLSSWSSRTTTSSLLVWFFGRNRNLNVFVCVHKSFRDFIDISTVLIDVWLVCLTPVLDLLATTTYRLFLVFFSLELDLESVSSPASCDNSSIHFSSLSLSLSLRRKLTARFHRVWKSRRENPAELFPFSLVLVWLFITATLFHPHFGELKNTFLSPILSCRPSNRLSSVWWCRCQCRATSSNKTAKVIYCF